MKKEKIKNFGQVFTPNSIVKKILDVAGYTGEDILKKHVIDNSCGDGAFLTEILERYVFEYNKKNNSLSGVEKEIKKYIHGIEIDTEIYNICLENLNIKAKELNLLKIKFNILNADTLSVTEFDSKMDYVVGNPPYVRVHNLNDKYDNVKKYSFCEKGMTDLYIVFYEIGLRMLKKRGTLCYITPNSFYNSLAGTKLREYIKDNKCMESLIDLGHYQAFDVTTYTTICKLIKNKKHDSCRYFKYKDDSCSLISEIIYSELFIDGSIILSEDNSKFLKCLSYEILKKPRVEVKNGFATLNDKVFISEKFDFKDNVIDVLKGSTGNWKKCIYPYDENGSLLEFNKLDKNLQIYLLSNKDLLIKKDAKVDSSWYAFGRSQAIKDVKYNKIAINTCIKDTKSIKLNLVEANKGVYSGLYILTTEPFEKIREIICTETFIEYLKILNKCKSGGYYTFSSKDLAKYINYSLEKDYE